MENEMKYQEIVDTLREGVVNLSFTKVKDGEVRKMRATLVSRTDTTGQDA